MITWLRGELSPSDENWARLRVILNEPAPDDNPADQAAADEDDLPPLLAHAGPGAGPRPHRVLRVAAVLVAIVIVGTGVWVVAGRSEESTTTVQPAEPNAGTAESLGPIHFDYPDGFMLGASSEGKEGSTSWWQLRLVSTDGSEVAIAVFEGPDAQAFATDASPQFSRAASATPSGAPDNGDAPPTPTRFASGEADLIRDQSLNTLFLQWSPSDSLAIQVAALNDVGVETLGEVADSVR